MTGRHFEERSTAKFVQHRGAFVPPNRVSDISGDVRGNRFSISQSPSGDVADVGDFGLFQIHAGQRRSQGVSHRLEEGTM